MRGYRYPTSHCLRFSKTKIPPTTAECLLATGILRRPWEPPTLSLFEVNSQGFPTLLSNSLGACFFSLFLACQDPSLLESGISRNNALVSLFLASPQRGQLRLSHLRWHSISIHPSSHMEPRQRGREGQVLFHLFLASTALHCS